MPVTIKKTDGGYKVHTPKSGAHSKKPMTLRNAIAQKLIIERAHKEKGGGK